MTSCLARQAVDAKADRARIADKILDALVEANGVPGMAAAVTIDGELVWSGVAGYRDVSRDLLVGANTIFRLASVSKVITAGAVAKLYEDGVLDIDAPLQAYVSYMPPDWPEMTARQLAAHLSGIPHYQPVDANLGDRRHGSTKDAVSVFTDRELLSEPGAEYHYSSFGYTLLSAAVEEAAGNPFLDYLESNIVKDLGIRPDALLFGVPNASLAYEFVDGAAALAEDHDYSYSWGGAGLSATAPALAMFGARMLAGDLVDVSTLDMMLAPARFRDGRPVRDRDYSVGLGWRVSRDDDGEPYAHHAGVAIGARSALAIVPGENVSAAILSNAAWTSSIEQTALTLALPFRAHSTSQDACPTDKQQYEGDFDGNSVKGTISFAVDHGVCTGIVSVGNAFGEWLNQFPQKDVSALKIIGLRSDGGLSRAALVTPIGAFELQNVDGVLTGRIGRGRMLRMNLAGA